MAPEAPKASTWFPFEVASATMIAVNPGLPVNELGKAAGQEIIAIKVQSSSGRVGGLISTGCLSAGISIAGAVRPGSNLTTGEEVTGGFCQTVPLMSLPSNHITKSGHGVRIRTLLSHSDGEGLGGGRIVIGISCLRIR